MRTLHLNCYNRIEVKKQLMLLPKNSELWIECDVLDFDLKPTIKLPSYFLYLEDLEYGMTADVWGYLSIEYDIDDGYSVYENNFSNALMCNFEKQDNWLVFSSFSRQKVLRQCRNFYKNKVFDLPKNYIADYV